jgi:hypothetical protein
LGSKDSINHNSIFWSYIAGWKKGNPLYEFIKADMQNYAALIKNITYALLPTKKSIIRLYAILDFKKYINNEV